MEWNLLWIGLGIAIAGYFIGDGLKNFKNPNAKGFIESLNEEDGYELIKENEVHYFMGMSKEDAKHLLEEHPDVPHIKINNNVYFTKEKLRNWLMNLDN